MCLAYHDRSVLYDRIDKRVDIMIENGLLEETERLYKDGVFESNLTAAGAIGYKELLGAVTGDMPLAEAVEMLKTATRRYAKRQITWFAAKDYALPLRVDEDSDIKTFEEIVNNAKKLFSL